MRVFLHAFPVGNVGVAQAVARVLTDRQAGRF
jgi:hypothetical protein